jgi:hypothetical protein
LAIYLQMGNSLQLKLMKHLTKAFAIPIAIVMILISGSSLALAQASATAAASAQVITPISITKVTDMNFGNVAVSALLSGTAILSPLGIRTLGGAGGVTLPSILGTVAAATFLVSGQANYTFAVTLPSSGTISDGSGHSITVTGFTSSPSGTGTLSILGIQTLSVGATLNLSAAQAANAYTNASAIPVTVNYN